MGRYDCPANFLQKGTNVVTEEFLQSCFACLTMKTELQKAVLTDSAVTTITPFQLVLVGERVRTYFWKVFCFLSLKAFFSSHLMADFCVWCKCSSSSNSARLLTVSLLHHPSVSVQMSDPTHTLVHCIFYFLEEAVSTHVMLRGLGTFDSES